MDQLADCTQRLHDGLAKMGIVLPENQIEQLICYLQEFYKWNQAYNLSAIRQPMEMVSRHLLDSLSLYPILDAYLRQGDKKTTRQIVDVGTGGGLPGIPLAITIPSISYTLLDSNGKKTRFLFQVKSKLGLNNVSIENNRVEKFSPADKFDIVTSRAFASLRDMVQGSNHLLHPNGEFWAMKGQYPEEELQACQEYATLEKVQSLQVPYSEGERHLVILKKHDKDRLPL